MTIILLMMILSRSFVIKMDIDSIAIGIYLYMNQIDSYTTEMLF